MGSRTQMTDDNIASIVRALAEGVDPGRVLREVANEALTRTKSSDVLLVAVLEGQLTPIVAVGTPYTALFDVGREAFTTGRAARRSDPAYGLAALAVPVRHRGVVLAALAVAGPGDRALDPDALTLPADCAALALAARPATGLLAAGRGRDGGIALAEGLAAIATAGPRDEVLAAALDVAAASFGARAGFVCLPTGPGGVEVASWRGLDRDRLGAASRHPGFTRLISGSAGTAPDVTVVAPTDPVLAQLSAGAEFAVSLPLVAGEPGALVLLVAEQPDAAGLRALEALRLQVSASLAAARSAGAVEAAGAELSTLIHALADPTLVVDGAGRFTAINPAAAELFALSDSFEIGRPARGRLGHPGLEALLLADGDGVLPDATGVVLGRPTPRRFVPAARPLGARGRVLFLRPAPVASPGERQTDEVAPALGRQLRDPLAAICSVAGTGLAGIATAGDWDVVRTAILAEAARIEAVADQLALLSPDGQGAAAVTVRAETLDVVALAAAVVGRRRAGAPDRTLTMVAPGRLEVSADRRLLERVLDPLLDNALRYSAGPVTVEVADRGETFEIAVVDTGPGIFSGDIPGLFERYHTLDGSPVRRAGGISLYTCRRLVDLMGGRLWCDSRLGVGSRFAVRLPR